MTPPFAPSLSADSQEVVDRACAIWRKAQVVYQDPAWEGQPEARAIAEQIASGHPECETALIAALQDKDQIVVAYALLTLEMMNSPVLLELPTDVLARRAKISLLMGSFSNAMDLGGLARQIQKRARQRPGCPEKKQ